MAVTATQVNNPYLLRNYEELATIEKTQARLINLATAVTFVAIAALFIAITVLAALSEAITPFAGATALVVLSAITKFLHSRVYTRLCGLVAHHTARHLEYVTIADKVNAAAQESLTAYAGCLGPLAVSPDPQHHTGIGVFLYHLESYEAWEKEHKDLSDFLSILRKELTRGDRYREVMQIFREKYELKGQNEFVEILEQVENGQVLRDDQKGRIEAELYLLEGMVYDIEEAYLLRHKVMAAYTVYVLRHAHAAQLPISEEAFTFHPDGVRGRIHGTRRGGGYFPGISRQDALPPYPLGTITEINYLSRLIEQKHTRLSGAGR